MQVKRRDDRNVACDFSGAPQDLGLAVVEILIDHGAVQIQVNAVKRPFFGKPSSDQSRDMFKGACGHLVGRLGSCVNQRDDSCAKDSID